MITRLVSIDEFDLARQGETRRVGLWRSKPPALFAPSVFGGRDELMDWELGQWKKIEALHSSS